MFLVLVFLGQVIGGGASELPLACQVVPARRMASNLLVFLSYPHALTVANNYS